MHTTHSPGTEVGTDVVSNTNATTSDPGKKRRSWFITLNNYTQADIDTLIEHCTTQCKYYVWQKEIGEECGTPHIHAFFNYKSPRVWPKRFFPTAHIEAVISNDDCIKYCKKEKTRVEGPFEGGIPPSQGMRSDLIKLAKQIKGDGLRKTLEMEENYANHIKYSRGLKEFASFHQQDRTEKPIVYWFWGLAGTGKTYKAVNLSDDYYIKDGTQWWDGYEQQSNIIIDDFDGKWPYRDLLRLLDRYKYSGQYKGGYVKINSKYICITCEHHPSYFWEDNTLDQVTRRIDVIEEIRMSPEQKSEQKSVSPEQKLEQKSDYTLTKQDMDFAKTVNDSVEAIMKLTYGK